MVRNRPRRLALGLAAWPALVVLLLSASGCATEGAGPAVGPPATQPAASSPAAPETALPAASATPPRLPSAVPALPSSRFQFGKSVSAGDRAAIQAGVSLASRYLRELAGVRPPAVTIYAYADFSEANVPWEGIASAAGNSPAEVKRDLGIYVAQTLPGTVLVNTGAQQWRDLTAVNQLRLAVHEYFHAVQMDLLGPKRAREFYSGAIDAIGPAGPHWLVEGSADYIGWAAMQSADLQSLDAHVAAQPESPIDVSEIATFLDFYSHGQDSYDAALAAVYSLTRANGPQSLVDYFRRIGQGQSWQAAFLTAFGITVADFYALYGS